MSRYQLRMEEPNSYASAPLETEFTWFVYDTKHHLPHRLTNTNRAKLVYAGPRAECLAFITRQNSIKA